MIELVVNLGKLASSIFTKHGMIVFNKICTVNVQLASSILQNLG